MLNYKTALSKVSIILILGLGFIAINNLQNQKIIYAATGSMESIALNREEIVQVLDGTYNVDFQVVGSHLDTLKCIYGNEIRIENGNLNGWKLHIGDIVQMANNEYVVNCTYLLRGKGTPPPMVEAKLIIKLSDDKIVRVIEHKSFAATQWPNGEWKTDMMLYRQ